jgi:hypothetical protein
MMAGLTVAPVQAADLGPVLLEASPAVGVPCAFEDGGPTIALPWPSVWLGHFSGGRFIQAAYGRALDWQDEKVCFPSRASCSRWISQQRHAFHNPEGFWTCLMIR